METKIIFIASETKHKENKEIPIGIEISESSIGPGVFDAITPAGYPQINGIAVTCLITKNGIIYQGFDNHLRLLNNRDNKTSLFYYRHEDNWIKEGEGIYSDAFYAKPYEDNLTWKIEIYEEGESIGVDSVPKESTESSIVKEFDISVQLTDDKVDALSKQHNEQNDKDERYAQELVDTISPTLLVSGNIDTTVLNHKNMLKNWIKDLMRENRNTEFYHGIVTEVGEMFGDLAKTSDDGSLQDNVLALKVPELVKQLIAENKTLKEKL